MRVKCGATHSYFNDSWGVEGSNLLGLMVGAFGPLNSKQECCSQSVRIRLALIRPTVQQLPVQNLRVEFRSRGVRVSTCGR